MKKPFLFCFTLWTLGLGLWTPPASGQVKFSDLGNATSLQSGDLFIIGRPGDKNYNITALQLPFELGLQPTNANLTAWSLLDPTTYATKAYAQGTTNGYPWGVLYDASGAALSATNGLGVSSQLAAFAPTNQFDRAGAATAATNGMAISTGLAAFVPTNTVQNYASNSAFVSALAQINSTSNILNGQISGGGINATTATNISQFVSNTTSNLLEATAASMTNNMGLSSGLAAFRSTNSLWDGQFTTNLINGSQVSAGNNITVTPSKIAGLGSTNYQVALSDPINLSQANIGTAWLTNVVIPTNSLASTVVDFNKGFTSTNISAGLTFTDVANVIAGAFNSAIVRVTASGADRPLAFPVSWHTNLNFIGVVTNGFQMDLLVTVTAARTNVAQVLYP